MIHTPHQILGLSDQGECDDTYREDKDCVHDVGGET
jgi:hypothetical protein